MISDAISEMGKQKKEQLGGNQELNLSLIFPTPHPTGGVLSAVGRKNLEFRARDKNQGAVIDPSNKDVLSS